MTYYEHDSQGWLIGSHEDPARPNSTTVAPPALTARMRWNGSAWTEDTTRETQEAADTIAERDRLRAAIDKCKAYDPADATAAEVKTTLGTTIYLLRQVFQELRS